MSRATLLFALLALGACSAPVTPPATQDATLPAMDTTAPPAAVLTVGELLDQAQRLQGRTVTLSGRYAGWTGRCLGGPPVSRSDWMIEDTARAACIYAHGPQPAGIPAPPQPASLGLPVRVTGQVELLPDGRPYLRVSPPSSPSPAKPA